MNIATTSTPRDKYLGQLLKASFATSLLIIAILAIIKIAPPSAHNGWSTASIVNVFLSIRALCSICVISIFSFQAWTKNTDEYYEWLVLLGILRFSYSKLIVNLLPKWTYLWMVRIVSIIALIVLFTSGLFLSAKALSLIK